MYKHNRNASVTSPASGAKMRRRRVGSKIRLAEADAGECTEQEGIKVRMRSKKGEVHAQVMESRTKENDDGGRRECRAI